MPRIAGHVHGDRLEVVTGQSLVQQVVSGQRHPTDASFELEADLADPFERDEKGEVKQRGTHVDHPWGLTHPAKPEEATFLIHLPGKPLTVPIGTSTLLSGLSP